MTNECAHDQWSEHRLTRQPQMRKEQKAIYPSIYPSFVLDNYAHFWSSLFVPRSNHKSPSYHLFPLLAREVAHGHKLLVPQGLKKMRTWDFSMECNTSRTTSFTIRYSSSAWLLSMGRNCRPIPRKQECEQRVVPWRNAMLNAWCSLLLLFSLRLAFVVPVVLPLCMENFNCSRPKKGPTTEVMPPFLGPSLFSLHFARDNFLLVPHSTTAKAVGVKQGTFTEESSDFRAYIWTIRIDLKGD